MSEVQAGGDGGEVGTKAARETEGKLDTVAPSDLIRGVGTAWQKQNHPDLFTVTVVRRQSEGIKGKNACIMLSCAAATCEAIASQGK